MAIFLFCYKNVNFAKCESCCLKGVQCPSWHQFSELTPQDHALIGAACLCMHTPPAQIQKSFPLKQVCRASQKPMGISGFACKYLPRKNGYFSTASSTRLLLQRKLPAVHACWFGTGTAHSLESGMKPQTPFAREPLSTKQVRACWTRSCILAWLFSKCHLKVSPPPPSSLCPQFYPSCRRQPSATKPQCGAWLAACIQQLLCSKFWASHSYPDSRLSYVFCLSCSTASWARSTTNWPAWTGCQHCSTVSLLSPVVCAFPSFTTLPALPDPKLVTSSKSSLHSRL